MYQGEVYVAEEDLSSFLEVAEDLNIRGLSQRNVQDFDANVGDTKCIDLSPKQNRSTIKSENIQKISDSLSSDSITLNIHGDECSTKNENESSNIIKETQKRLNRDLSE